jgi:pyruvate/2-oxoglutarate dehydrogenase complex dihydrolipoamide dehydrogenase (E3) component
MDGDATKVIEAVLRREGVRVLTGTKLLDARRLGGLKEIVFEQDGRTARAQAEEIFFALGRVPNTAALGLERIGITTESGRIPTNLRMQTVVAHMAVLQGETAAHNLVQPDRPKEMDYRLLTEIVFTEPQLAVVGLTELEAHARNVPFLAASYPFNDHGKSMIMEANDGFVKLLADPATGEILGGGCVGPVGGELIHEIIMAMAKRMTVRELAATPHYHPTLAEIWTYPAEELAQKVS